MKMKKFVSALLGTVMVFSLSSVAAFAETTGGQAISSTNQDVAVQVTVDPTITMTLDTNSITFGNVSPLTEKYDLNSKVNITIQSNNLFSIKAQAKDDFKTAGENPLVMTVDHLKLKASASADFLTVSKDAAVTVVDNQPATGSTVYPVDFRFMTDWQVKPGNYSTIVNFVASQI